MVNHIISNEKREFIIRWHNEGKTVKEITVLMPDIPRTSIYNVIKKYEQTGLIHKEKKGGPRVTKLDQEILNVTRNILREDCSKTLREIKDKIFENTGTCLGITSVFRACKGINFTLKKNNFDTTSTKYQRKHRSKVYLCFKFP